MCRSASADPALDCHDIDLPDMARARRKRLEASAGGRAVLARAGKPERRFSLARAPELAALHRVGFLQSAFMIAASLGNLQRLVNRKAALLDRAAA